MLQVSILSPRRHPSDTDLLFVLIVLHLWPMMVLHLAADRPAVTVS